MISSLIGFWLPVRAFASDDPTRVQNVLLILLAVAIVLLVVALWSSVLRPFVLGAVAGLAVGAGAALALSVAFGGA